MALIGQIAAFRSEKKNKKQQTQLCSTVMCNSYLLKLSMLKPQSRFSIMFPWDPERFYDNLIICACGCIYLLLFSVTQQFYICGEARLLFGFNVTYIAHVILAVWFVENILHVDTLWYRELMALCLCKMPDFCAANGCSNQHSVEMRTLGITYHVYTLRCLQTCQLLCPLQRKTIFHPCLPTFLPLYLPTLPTRLDDHVDNALVYISGRRTTDGG